MSVFKTKVYVASALANAERVKEYYEALRNRGFEITYDWTVHGKVDNYQEKAKISVAEVNAVICAEVLVMLLPGDRGTHVELGVALAMNNRVIVVDEGLAGVPSRPSAFYAHPLVDAAFDMREVISNLERWRK